MPQSQFPSYSGAGKKKDNISKSTFLLFVGDDSS